MSIIVTNIRCEYDTDRCHIIKKALKSIGLCEKDVISADIFRESLDLRHGNVSKIFSVELDIANPKAESTILEKYSTVYAKQRAEMPTAVGDKKIPAPPVVVGFGPAGMFAALILAENGFKPIVLERGASMAERDKCVKAFFDTGKLNTSSNIQFGEGGAGAYSDGKLTTRINDPICQLVLDTFKEHGAPEDIIRLAKPHIGTDLLKDIVVSIRKRIELLGGQVKFNTQVTDIITENGRIKSLVTTAGIIDTEVAIFAIGHSARDTAEMLLGKGVMIEPKAFSVGLRVEHKRTWVDRSVYGKNYGKYNLPSAEYALSAKPFDRGCYSFCMCPGGQVIAAASEEGGIVTNGMSLHSRSADNSNSALCVSVLPSDFPSSSPLSGIEYQRELEKSAFKAGGGNYCAPVQTVGDFLNDEVKQEPKEVISSYPIGVRLTNFSDWLPKYVSNTLKASMPIFAKKLSCFGNQNAVLSGIESRTSSPIRILRNDSFNSPSLQGLIPCGEGAGYAGGIMSAAVDGVKAATAILQKFKSL